LHIAAISAIIRGAVKPTAQTLVALAGFFNVPAENLFRLAGYLRPTDQTEVQLAEALELLRQLPAWRREEAIAQLRLQVQLAQQQSKVYILGGERTREDEDKPQADTP